MTETINTETISKYACEGIALCMGVIQQYLAGIADVPVETLWPKGLVPVNEIGFRRPHDGLTRYLRLFVTDEPYYNFDFMEFNNDMVRDTMNKILIYIKEIGDFMIKEISKKELARQELFDNSRFIVTPMSSVLMYNDKYGRDLHDKFPLRIAFEWSPVTSAPVTSDGTTSHEIPTPDQ